MSAKLDRLIRDLKNAIRGANKKTTSSLDTPATVTRVEGDTIYVHIDGGVPETPVKRTIDAKVGDVVQIRSKGGQAWMTGNQTAPPTDDTKATEAEAKARSADIIAKLAQKTADKAGKTATNYLSWSAEYGLIVSEDATENPEEMEGGSTRVTYDGVEMYKGQTRVAKFGETSVIGDEDSAHAYLDPDTFNITNEYGAEFFAVDMDGAQQVVPYYKTVSSVIEVSSEASMTISDSPDFDFVADGSNIAVEITLSGGGFIDEADWNVVKGTAETTTVTSVAGTPFTLTYDGEHAFTVAWDNTIRRSGRLDIIEKPVMATPSLTCGTRRGTRGAFSSVMGQELTAEYPLQVVFGRHNVNKIYNLLEIGWGTYNIPRTVFAVDEVGNVECNNLPAMVECGIKTGATTPANSYLSFTVSFDKNFTSAPIVTATLQATSSSVDFNKVQISVYNISTTGFYVRVYNGMSSQISPNITWIAMQKEALIHT